jgi:excisionase family DNA binding protein
MFDNNEFLTVTQVSEILQVHWQTILNYIKTGKIDAVRLGKGYRISRKSGHRFVEENQTNGQSD